MRKVIAIALFLLLPAVAHGQASLPVIPQGELEPLRINCAALLKALDELGAPLPEETRKSLRAILKAGGQDAAALEKIQQLLDPYCLAGVNINPESRVKVARGPARAELVQNHWTVMLIKIHNEAGVTQVPRLTSPHIRAESNAADDGRWLEADVYTKSPMKKELSGHAVEYVILRFRPHEAGKREARLIFDVGQGTQDLGFRAELPVLFAIKKAESREHR